MYRHILVGTDLSSTAAIAVERASALAKGLGAELTLVHAGSDPGDRLKELAASAGGEAVAAQGPPAEVLVAQAEERGADLLVVGSVGMSGARRFLLGSVPNKVSHHAPRDLLIVKTDPPPHEIGLYRSILVGTDGSPTATVAVERAATLAGKLGAKPTVVCAYQAPSEEELERMRSDPNDPVAQWHQAREISEVPDEFRWRVPAASQAQDVLERAEAHVAKGGVEADIRAIEGQPADVLLSLAKAEDIDLIAIGSVGMSGARRLMLGNVPHRISHHAPTDVLIFKTS